MMATPFLLRDSCPHFIDEEPKRVSKYMKRCSNSSVINRFFFFLKNYHFTSLRLAKIRKRIMSTGAGDIGILKPLYIARINVELYTHSGVNLGH